MAVRTNHVSPLARQARKGAIISGTFMRDSPCRWAGGHAPVVGGNVWTPNWNSAGS